MIEDVTALMKSYLTSNLEAALVVIDAARSVTIPRWKQMELHPVPVKDYVSIEILGGQEEFNWGEDDAPLREGPVELSHVMVRVFAGGPVIDDDTFLTLHRYVEAFRDLSITDWTYGDVAHRIMPMSAEYDVLQIESDDVREHRLEARASVVFDARVHPV